MYWSAAVRFPGNEIRPLSNTFRYTVYSFETSDVGITEAVRRMWKA